MRVLIRVIEISPNILTKINSKHHLSEEDIVHACEHYSQAGWDDDPERGVRLLIKGQAIGGRPVRIVLFPVNVEVGVFRLVTAFAGQS